MTRVEARIPFTIQPPPPADPLSAHARDLRQFWGAHVLDEVATPLGDAPTVVERDAHGNVSYVGPARGEAA